MRTYGALNAVHDIDPRSRQISQWLSLGPSLILIPRSIYDIYMIHHVGIASCQP